ncbi:MAG: hypothetical protein JO256_02845 [Alphaproteobacteria bacterium]|nr:hypothetical protein [Alphaproteobacteria bacterium]
MIAPRLIRVAAACGLILSLAACMAPAPYGPRRPGETTGYTDRELAPGRYRITFTGNSVTARETVENYLLLRAAEVTLAAGGTHFIFDDRDTRARTTVHADPAFYGPGYWGGGFGFWGFRPMWGYSAFGPPLMISQTTRYEAYAEIVVLKPDQARNENRAVDARAIIDHLGPSAAPPNPDHV